MVLSLNRLTKQYQDRIAVDRISMEFREGIYGFLGANGAGKTTLMRLICGVLAPTSGEVKINDKNNLAMGEEFRNLLGYLPQDFGYYPDFTAEEFLRYIASLKGLFPEYAKMRTKELLEIVGLSEVRKKRIKTFSGGMKQRLGIAQAMLNDPKILILDEPTAGLDPKERVRFRNLISDFGRDKIIILSTHIVSDVEAIADQILIMKDGQIQINGTVNELEDSMKGKVWECVRNKGETDEIIGRFLIANMHHEGPMTRFRIIAEEQPFKNAAVVPGTLEDLYLFHFRDGGEE